MDWERLALWGRIVRLRRRIDWLETCGLYTGLSYAALETLETRYILD